MVRSEGNLFFIQETQRRWDYFWSTSASKLDKSSRVIVQIIILLIIIIIIW